jgi:endonuclease III
VVNKKERYEAVVDYFEKVAPDAETELQYKTPFQLLVAVILSAQCTDKRVNQITPNLFKTYPNAKVLAVAKPEAVFELIRSISYPNSKSKHLVGMAQMLMDKFNGKLPKTVEELMLLPGVGRKTANVIVSVLFDVPAMAVDTHVFRVAERIGLTTGSKNPLQTERELVKFFPTDILSRAHHWLILHGRYICTARNPKCLSCGLQTICKFFNKKNLSTKKVKKGLKK